jgi:hypothetical protein
VGQSGVALTAAALLFLVPAAGADDTPSLGGILDGQGEVFDHPAPATAPVPGASGVPQDDGEVQSPFARPPEQFRHLMSPLPSMKRDAESDYEEDERLREATQGPRMGALLENIEGATELEVTGADGKTRVLPEGERILTGDVLRTGPGISLRIAFESEAQVLVTPGSELSVVDEREDEGGDKIPSLELRRGEVRALVPPSSEPRPAEKPAASPAPVRREPFRFIVRSRAAVMGVRGTDFIVAAPGEDELSVHTLSGAVEVASEPAKLYRREGVDVPAGRFTTAFGGGRGVNRARAFDPGSYLLRFHERHPKLQSLWKTAAREHQTGRLRYRMERVRWERKGMRRKGSDPGLQFAPPPATGAPRKKRRGTDGGMNWQEPGKVRKRKGAWSKEVLKDLEEPKKPRKKIRKRRPGR